MFDNPGISLLLHSIAPVKRLIAAKAAANDFFDNKTLHDEILQANNIRNNLLQFLFIFFEFMRSCAG